MDFSKINVKTFSILDALFSGFLAKEKSLVTIKNRANLCFPSNNFTKKKTGIDAQVVQELFQNTKRLDLSVSKLLMIKSDTPRFISQH